MPNTHSYNSDVLTCLANLSADEVFTPLDIATPQSVDEAVCDEDEGVDDA